MFLATVTIIATLHSEQGPRGAAVPLQERMRLMGRALPLLAIIFLSIGGIYAGVFTPVEAYCPPSGLPILRADQQTGQ